MLFDQNLEDPSDRVRHNLAITVACMTREGSDFMELDEFPQFVVVKKGTTEYARYHGQKVFDTYTTQPGNVVYEIFEKVE